MAIQFVGGRWTNGTGASYDLLLSGTLYGGIASSPSEGDLIIVCSAYGSSGNAGAPTVTGDVSGAYNAVHAGLYANDTWDTNLRTFYQFAGATPDTTLTLTRQSNSAYGGVTVVHVWRGVDPTTPFDVASLTATGNNASRPNPPSITPVTSGAVIVACGAGTQPASTGNYFGEFGGTMVNAISGFSDGSTSDMGAIIASHAWTSGAYDPGAATGGATSTSCSWAAATMALRPAPEPPPEGNTGAFFAFF